MEHPERYKIFLENPKNINMFIEQNCLFQLNAGSLIGTFGKEVQSLANLYRKNNIYNFFGSDAHRDTGRNADIRKVLNKLSLSEKELYIDSAKKVINNDCVVFKGRLL